MTLFAFFRVNPAQLAWNFFLVFKFLFFVINASNWNFQPYFLWCWLIFATLTWVFNGLIFIFIGYPLTPGLGGWGAMLNSIFLKILSYSWSLLFIAVINAKKYRIGPILGVPEPHEVLWVVGPGWLEAEMQLLLLYGNLNFSLF